MLVTDAPISGLVIETNGAWVSPGAGPGFGGNVGSLVGGCCSEPLFTTLIEPSFSPRLPDRSVARPRKTMVPRTVVGTVASPAAFSGTETPSTSSVRPSMPTLSVAKTRTTTLEPISTLASLVETEFPARICSRTWGASVSAETVNV